MHINESIYEAGCANPTMIKGGVGILKRLKKKSEKGAYGYEWRRLIFKRAREHRKRRENPPLSPPKKLIHQLENEEIFERNTETPKNRHE